MDRGWMYGLKLCDEYLNGVKHFIRTTKQDKNANDRLFINCAYKD